MSFGVAAAIWGAMVALAAFTGVWQGYGGRRFLIALGVASVLFGFALFLAAPAVRDRFVSTLRSGGAVLATLAPLFALLIYAFGVTHDWRTLLIGAAYVVAPAILVGAAAGNSGGAWEDYVAILIIWLPVEFRWAYRFFPYPPVLTSTLAVLLALSTGVAAFVLLRKLDGIGYAVEWKRGFTWQFLLNFGLFAGIAVPLGMNLHFLAWDPSFARVRSLPLFAPGILLFTAWPEEFLFRGVLQNVLARTFKSRWSGLLVASLIFGFSHIFHAPFPNWKYVLLATIAGLFYGHTWMRTGSLFPGALVHAFVDISWHVLFR